MTLRPLVFVFALLASACGYTRVSLREVPSPAAPLDERVQAYEDLAPTAAMNTIFLRNNVQVGASLDYLVLGDGTRVEDPRDLSPAVDSASPTAKAIVEFDAAFGTYRGLSLAGTIASVVGLGVMLSSVAFIGSAANSRDGLFGGGSPFLPLLIAGGATTLVGSVLWMIAGYGPGRTASAARTTAFTTYPRSLQKRLSLEQDRPVPPPKGVQSAALMPQDAPLLTATR